MKTLTDILRDIENLEDSIELIVVDLFCGAGGYSWGVEKATVNGKHVAKVLICVNHDAKAIQSHYANMPDALHFIEDIRTVGLNPMVMVVDKVRRLYPHIKIELHASLECTNHSRAKGGMSRDADSRTLAEHLFRYVEALQPDYISIENVEEFMVWGPLIIKVVKDKKTGEELYCPLDVKRDKKTKALIHAPVWVPDPAHKAEYYNKWVADVKRYGYKFDHRILNSANYGARTSRKRFFGLFARPELPIAWPAQTHAKNPTGDLFSQFEKWLPVRDVLDLHNEGESIFARKIPLVDATIERITAGVVKFVSGGKDAFLVKYNSMSQRKTYVPPSIDDPCPVVSTQGRLGVTFISRYNSGSPMDKNISIDGPCGTVTTENRFATVNVSFLSKYYSGNPNSKNISIEGPSGTITTSDHHSLVSAEFLSAYYGNGHNHSLNVPSPTLTTKDRLAFIKPCFLDMQYGNGTPSDANMPAPTVTTNPKHQLVTCNQYLLNPQYNSAGGSINNPCFTLIARMDKQPPYLMTATTDGQLPSFIKRVPGGLIYEIYDTDSAAVVKLKEVMALEGITDIKMRMLVIIELLRIMGFPSTYVLKGTQEDQKKFIGNAVEVTQAKVNTEALCSAIIQLKIAA